MSSLNFLKRLRQAIAIESYPGHEDKHQLLSELDLAIKELEPIDEEDWIRETVKAMGKESERYGWDINRRSVVAHVLRERLSRLRIATPRRTH